MNGGPPPDARAAEIADRLVRVRGRIAAAADSAGRDPSEITLIAVTKTYPAEDVGRLADLGVTAFGENRDAEARVKAAAVGERAHWHFIGQLQRNKAGSVVRYAEWIHSVDRPELVDALARAAERIGARPQILIQVSLDGDPRRGGADPGRVAELADAVAEAGPLRLRGVMAVPPLGADADGAYARLAEISAALRERRAAADVISAGMSGDLEAAVRRGATHLRIGSALLGARPPVVG